MKKVSVLLLLTVLSPISISSFAQGKYGKDSVECTRNLTYYSDYIKQGNFAEAAPLWREAFCYCPPGVRQTLYVDGQKIFKFLIEKNMSNVALKNSLIDSLMMMYDLRSEYFPKYILTAQTNKALDMDNYKGDQNKLVLDAFEKVIKMGGPNVEPRVFSLAMQRVSDMYTKKEIDAEKVMSLYTSFTPILEAQIKANYPDAASVKKDVDNLFAMSGVASCENIVALFTPKYDATPNDEELVSGIVSLLNNRGCYKEPLFLKAVESLYKMDPTHQSAYYLYKLYSMKEDYTNAAKMLQEAIDSDQSGPKEDAEYLYTLASIYYSKLESPTRAISLAKRAAELDPSYRGKVYMLMGSVWASSNCVGNEIEKRAKWWVAVDFFVKAKNTDSSLSEEADRFISAYRQYFPKQEDAFMYDITDGSSYIASCSGMRESTTVRTIK